MKKPPTIYLFMTMLTGFLFSLPGCIIDVSLHPLRDPGPLEDPVDENKVDQGSETDIDTFDPIIDDQVRPEIPDCDYSCEAGWTTICFGAEKWCISQNQGYGTCCEALQHCQTLSAFPGIWPNAGSVDTLLPLPSDYSEYIDLPSLLMVWSGDSSPPGEYLFNISCMNSDGIKVEGETHNVPGTMDCSGLSCELWTHPADPECNGQYIGCGNSCLMPYWCWKQ